MKPTPLTDAMIEAVRVKLGKKRSQARHELAAHLGVSDQHFSNWMLGHRRPNGEKTLMLLEWLKNE